MSKLLKKAIVKWFQHEIITTNLIPTIQFGGHTHSSCLDTGLTLLHDIQLAHVAGLKAWMVLFNVKGFFDSVNHDWMIGILENLGFAPEVVDWADTFLADCKIRLRFNSITSDERVQPVGVPQSSPLSLVLLILYMSSLLLKMREWPNSSLGMYIDDGVLFTCVEEWAEVQAILRDRYSVCEEWLSRSSLAIKPEKTEAIFFQSLGCISRLSLPHGSYSGIHHIPPTMWCVPPRTFDTWVSSSTRDSSGTTM